MKIYIPLLVLLAMIIMSPAAFAQPARQVQEAYEAPEEEGESEGESSGRIEFRELEVFDPGGADPRSRAALPYLGAVSEWGGPCEAPEPEIIVDGSSAECKWWRADECDKPGESFFGWCDTGYDDGVPIVFGYEYEIELTVKNVESVTDGCHDFKHETANFDSEKVVTAWLWDGPYKTQPDPPYYTEVFPDPMPSATHSGCPVGWICPMQRGGRFDCEIKAYGKCGKVKSLGYMYHCP